ncbi:MAG: GRRM system radical SAM/SPASM domain protein [Burkholderiales bacterium]|nr:GRRM system radical SAM/SPASM domain protein [Burkholderiales bacterium]
MVQSTTFCNIDCSYCYLPNRDSKGRFDLARLPLLLKKLDAAGLVGLEFSLVWHAGEPLVLPADYYRQAFETVKRSLGERVRIRHSFQTNAMLVTEEHCKLFKEYGASIGVSIDGPDFVHDRFRRTRSGAGTHAQAMRGVELLRSQGIPFTTISVVTADALPHADEIFDFLVGLKPLEIGFNVDELEGENLSSTLTGAESQYRAFMKRIMDRALTTKGAPTVRELKQAFGAVQGSVFGATAVSSECNPLSILNVGIDGRLTTYSPELLDSKHPVFGDISFGTIESVDFTKLFDEPKFIQVHEEVMAGVEKCRDTCGYFDACGGGAPSNKLAEHGTFAATETAFCRQKYKITTDLAHEHVVARLAEVGRARVKA